MWEVYSQLIVTKGNPTDINTHFLKEVLKTRFDYLEVSYSDACCVRYRSVRGSWLSLQSIKDIAHNHPDVNFSIRFYWDDPYDADTEWFFEAGANTKRIERRAAPVNVEPFFDSPNPQELEENRALLHETLSEVPR